MFILYGLPVRTYRAASKHNFPKWRDARAGGPEFELLNDDEMAKLAVSKGQYLTAYPVALVS